MTQDQESAGGGVEVYYQNDIKMLYYMIIIKLNVM